ncbi:hypothetical protein [Geodermatophilus sp. DSM 44513]|uniref:hypothetical protein n=1 Tax=Geodermatophilus sp. DSM 44513 TaxID=1528104 RepID=UPI0012880BA9|nr:hypothetical protein [Geodermatophilus sp. DSM 44513]WNV75616.1 hypothetical protein RTG05_21960 [Geodermatophilus sp. DSM 44513]
MELSGARVLAFGTSGDQGSGLVEALRAHGAVPVVATSRAGRVAQLRADGEEAVQADLTAPDAVAAAAGEAGAVAAVLHVPLAVSTRGGAGSVVASVGALTAAGLPVAVNLGTVLPPPGAPDPFGAAALAEGLLGTGAAVLGVTAYLENHATPWALGPLSRGELVYPRPAGDPIAWMTARDVTAAAVAALARDVRGRALQLSGPTVLSFDQLAAEVGAGLGREVVYRRITPDEFADLLRPVLGPEAAAGVAGGYAAMPEEPNPLMAVDSSAAWAELGVTPTLAREWAAQVLSSRLQQAAAPS